MNIKYCSTCIQSCHANDIACWCVLIWSITTVWLPSCLCGNPGIVCRFLFGCAVKSILFYWEIRHVVLTFTCGVIFANLLAVTDLLDKCFSLSSWYVYVLALADWGFVDHGHSTNLKPVADSKHPEGEPYKIIVSRSHAGTVENVVKKSMGQETVIIPAGGAGMSHLLLLSHQQVNTSIGSDVLSVAARVQDSASD